MDSRARSRRTLVIGYGNTLRGDDAVGRLIAEAIADWELPGVTALSVHQLVPELAADIAEADRVVFVDAAVAAADASDVDLSPVEPTESDRAQTHFVSPGGLVALTEVVYGSRPECLLVCVPGVQFDVGEGLSQAARGAMDRALKLVRDLLG
jgi:hydrogenase maturation protease